MAYTPNFPVDGVTVSNSSTGQLQVGAGYGLLSARPVSSSAFKGRQYFATDMLGGTLYYDNGTVWIAQAVPVRLAANTPDINGTTSTGLSIAVPANNTYRFKAYIIVNNANGTITAFQIHAMAAGATIKFVTALQSNPNIASGPIGNPQIITAVTTNINSFPVGGTTTLTTIIGEIIVGANATTLQIDVVGTNTTDSIMADSWMEVTPLV